MTGASSKRPLKHRVKERERVTRRRRLAAICMIAAIGAATYVVSASGGGSNPTSIVETGTRAAPIELVAGDDVVASIEPVEADRLAAGRGRLPVKAERIVKQGSARLTLRVDEPALRDALAEAEGGSRVEVPERTISSKIDAPIFQQAFQDNCETAALSILLSTVGVEKDQLDLQEQITAAEPLDPEIAADGKTIWGDPDLGFVGRVDGGGPAGGFGAFTGPVMELASRWSNPVDLTGVDPQEVYSRLRSGRAVMVWIGLSDGPYTSWRSPEGRKVTVNYGEHTVVLTGIEGDQISVNDPIDGLRKVWTKADFEAKWDLLDNRAIGL